MKRLIITFLSIGLLLASCVTPAPPPEQVYVYEIEEGAPAAHPNMWPNIIRPETEPGPINNIVPDEDGYIVIHGERRHASEITGIGIPDRGMPPHIPCADEFDAFAGNISHFVNLRSLTIIYPFNLSDLTPLADLTNLTELWLSGNQISDLAPLANLSNLTHLQLSENQINDLTPLANLTNLRMLFLSNNQIHDLTPLANLTNLEDLWLYGNQVTDFTPLMELTSLLLLVIDDTIDTEQLETLRVALPDCRIHLIDWATIWYPQ